MRYKIFFYLAFSVVLICKGDRTVPVFIFDFDGATSHLNIEPNPFAKLSSERFDEIVREVNRSSKAVINFIEERFCAEDTSARDTKGSAYTHLRNALTRGQVRYFPSVEDPYSALKRTFDVHSTNVYRMSDSRIRIHDPQHKHYYVHFSDDVSENRLDTLRKHDNIMREVYFAMKDATGGPVVAFYTGKSNPVVVKRLAAAPLKRKVVSIDSSVVFESNEALFRFSGVYSSSASRHSRFSQVPIVSEEKATRRHLSTKVAYTDFDLQFNFSFKNEGWTIDDIALLEGGEEVGRSEVGGGAPWGWSYVCGEPLVVINTRDGSAVTINHYQIQPFRRAGRSYGLQEDGKTPGAPPPPEAPPAAPPAPPPEAPPDTSPEAPPAPPAEKSPAAPPKAPPAAPPEAPPDASLGPPPEVPSEASPEAPPPTEASTPETEEPPPGAPEPPPEAYKPKSFGKSVHCGPYFNAPILAGLMVATVLLFVMFVGIVALFNCRSNSRYDDPQSKPLVIASEGH